MDKTDHSLLTEVFVPVVTEEAQESTQVATVKKARKKGRAREGFRDEGPPLTFPPDPGRPSCCMAAEFSPV
ncbi:hypothetical protein E2C01_060322 [Portunus trituberculatus]|uniref:Uncharacterized protein n=1 Tax=Portunus trituberculatus TaxID=210409 RepID=A0A5B7H8E4_PORTR|nr:hypothetical protein [Portunus trituberculatus]